MSRFAIANENLALLQDIIRKDPVSYKDEFMSRYEHFNNLLNIIRLDPENTDNEQTSELIDVVNFMASVAHFYADQSKEFGATVMNLLESGGENLQPDLRMSLCKALVVLRNRKVISAVDTLALFMQLIKCQDKALRKFIFSSIINYLKNINAKRKDQKLNSSLQLFIYAKLKDSRSVVVRTSLLLLVDAYRRNIWPDARTANALAECCFHKVAKIQVSALKFFLGSKIEDVESSDDEDPNAETRTMKQVMLGYRVGKKTNKRKKHMEQAQKALTKDKKKSKNEHRHDCNVRACHQLHDPQSFAERLMRRLESKTAERFEVRLMVIALLAKLIGIHKLQVLSFYSYIQRFLQPHQREVTHLLLYAAQATHELVPPDIVESMLRTLSNNFITDRNSSEAITVGLNTVRQILANCPFAVDEDLLRDFAAYKTYKNKNVTVAARSIIQLYRTENPHLLHRKDRGMPSLATKEHEPLKFATKATPSTIAGAECLLEKPKVKKPVEPNNDDDEEDSEEELELDEGSGSDMDGEEISDSEEEEDDDNDDDEQDVEDEETPPTAKRQKTDDSVGVVPQPEPSSVDPTDAVADLLCSGEILDDADFRRIHRHQLRKHTMSVAESKRRAARQAADAAEQSDEMDDTDDDDNDDSEEEVQSDDQNKDAFGLTSLQAIEHFSKKPRRQNKAERMAQVAEGREGREKFGRPKDKGFNVGRNNKEIAKNKNFMMVRQKHRGQKRQRSFQERQRSMKNALKQQQGRKRKFK